MSGHEGQWLAGERNAPAGRFTGCIRVRDYAPLSKAEGIKLDCPKVGIAREEEGDATSELMRYS